VGRRAVLARVLELAYGSAPMPSDEDAQLPENADDVRRLDWHELQVLAARLVTQIPAEPTTNIER